MLTIFSLFSKINHQDSIWKPIVDGALKIICSIQVVMYGKVYLFLNSWNINPGEWAFLKQLVHNDFEIIWRVTQERCRCTHNNNADSSRPVFFFNAIEDGPRGKSLCIMCCRLHSKEETIMQIRGTFGNFPDGKRSLTEERDFLKIKNHD